MKFPKIELEIIHFTKIIYRLKILNSVREISILTREISEPYHHHREGGTETSRRAHSCWSLKGLGGVQNRGFGSEVSDLRGDLDANERVEMGNTCLGGE